METTARRIEILLILSRRRHETVCNLANEFGVSERTIRRDIEMLSCIEPIYTRQGRYGGIYVTENFSVFRKYMNENEINLLNFIIHYLEEKNEFKADDIYILQRIIVTYTKPTFK